jgi:hypothetical protein
MAGKGRALSEQDVQRVVFLLNTDMAASQIAERMQCSRSTVSTINRKFKVRDYAGHRSTWETPSIMPGQSEFDLMVIGRKDHEGCITGLTKEVVDLRIRLEKDVNH